MHIYQITHTQTSGVKKWLFPVMLTLSSLVSEAVADPVKTQSEKPRNLYTEVPQKIIMTGRRWTTNSYLNNFISPADGGEGGREWILVLEIWTLQAYVCGY